jgi:hypothetical protein
MRTGNQRSQTVCGRPATAPATSALEGPTIPTHRRAVCSLRAVALDVSYIALLATFCEQFAGLLRVPDDEWITIDSGADWRIGRPLAGP